MSVQPDEPRFSDRVRLGVTLLRWFAATSGPPVPARRPPVVPLVEEDAIAWLRSVSIAGIHHLARSPTCPEQRLTERVLETQTTACRAVLTALAAAGIPTLTFKSIELIHRVGGGRPPSTIGDCDIVVPRPAVEDVRSLLRDLGYRQARATRGPAVLVPYPPDQIARTERDHYELAPFRQLFEVRLEPELRELHRAFPTPQVSDRAGTTQVVVKIDVHHAFAADLPVGEAFSRSVPSVLGAGGTLSPVDHLWIGLARLQAEVVGGKRSLRELALLAALLVVEEIDWARFVDEAERRGIHKALGAFLWFLDRVTGRVPAEVIDELRSPWNEGSWPLASLFETPTSSAVDHLLRPDDQAADPW